MTAVQQKITALGIPKDAVRTLASICSWSTTTPTAGRRRAATWRATPSKCASTTRQARRRAGCRGRLRCDQLHGLRFDVKRREALEREALQPAVVNAMARRRRWPPARSARSIASFASKSLSVGGGPVPMMEAMAMRRADTPTPVAAGELEIRAQVRLTARDQVIT